MMTTHLLKDERVTFIETHSWSDLSNELDTNIGVVTRPTFADVVQQGADNEKVRPIDAVYQRRGIRCRLTEVTVNCEAVIGVALRAATNDRPLRKNWFPQAALIKRFNDLNSWATGEEKFNEQTASFLGPWSR
ncbi:unannotated protein [freshwater metagenome]|uniref:Unannotated protein n=1 Tax=freshwater metagenome TaxID=449393 RepID=A0A6J6D870_9ZZZZ